MLDQNHDADARESLLSVPSTETLSKSSLSPAFAFFLAVSHDLVDLLILAYAMKMLLPEGFTLTEGKPLYDATYKEAYNYGIMPYNFTDNTGGMGMDAEYAKEFARQTAYNLVNNATFGLPLTAFSFTMIAILALAVLSVLLRSFRLFFNYHAGNIDLRYPLSKEDCSAEIAIQSQASFLKNTDDCLMILEKCYLNLAAGNAKKEQTFAYRMFSIPHRLVHRHFHPWLPNLAQLYSFSGVAIIAALYVALVEDAYNATLGLSYYEQYKHEQLEYLRDTTQTGAYCSTEDKDLACYSIACAFGSVYSTFAQMNHIGFNTKFWYWAGPIFAAALTPALDRFYKWRFGYDTTLSPVFTFARVAGQDLPKLLIFNLAINELLSGGYAIYLGKPLYDRMYTTMFVYAITPIPDGLSKTDDDARIYAMLSAYNFFVDFINENMVAWTTLLTISLLSFSAFNFISRSCTLLKAHSDGMIELDKPMSDEEQEQYLQSHPREWSDQYPLPTFTEKYYLNHAVKENKLRGEWIHWFYEKAYQISNVKIHKQAPNLSDCYSPIKIGLITVLTVAVILNMYINLKAQSVYQNWYEKKYNEMGGNTLCVTDDEVMYCQSMAAQNAVGYALNDFMGLMSGTLGQALYLSPLVMIGSIFILSLILKIMASCNKNNANNSDPADFIERESEDDDQRIAANENGVVATPLNFFQKVKEMVCGCMQNNNERRI